MFGLFGGLEPELELDASEFATFERQTQRLAAAIGRPAGEVLREETRLLVQDLLASTPPFGRHGFLEDLEKQYFIGRRAVRRDIRRVFRPVTTLRAWRQPVNPRVKRELARAVRKGDTATVAKILKFHNSRVIARAVAALHQRARNDAGTVPADFRWYVVLDEQSIRDYETEVFERIGKAKAGWETAARAVGVPVPEWIARHSTPGRFREVNGPDGPSIEIANEVEYGDKFDELRILERALARREKSMEDRLNRTLGERFAQLAG